MDVFEDTIKAPRVRIGAHRGKNFAEISDDGFLTLHGDGAAWDDLDFPIFTRTAAVGQPTMDSIQGNIQAPSWDIDDYFDCEGKEIPHKWKEGTNWHWHLHLFTNGVDVDDRAVKFRVEFTYANAGNVLTDSIILESPDLVIPANTPDRTHLRFNVGVTTPDFGTKVGAQIYTRFSRIAAEGTSPSSDPFVPMLQIHFLCDTLGSRTIGAK